MNTFIRGYAEGFYGRLLSWSERLQILDCLVDHGLNTYYYAPKEDACHRLHWRKPYSASWRKHFRCFCTQARDRKITVIAGVAPGIDFDFRHLSDGADFQSLVEKCVQLLSDGASAISLLLDDIDADFHTRDAGIASEGLAHAMLANKLSIDLDLRVQGDQLAVDYQGNGQLWVTPRIYADDLAVQEPDYLPDFLGELEEKHLVLYCGSDVVSRCLSGFHDQLIRRYSNHRVVVWDNLYANDYCPRRLFVGPWQGREGVQDILLNPVGLVQTDCLLLDLMASFKPESSVRTIHEEVLLRHGVPECFLKLVPYFYHPVFNRTEPDVIDDAGIEIYDALEFCLWRWKSVLSREWYPYLFGLKHDLLIHDRQLAPDRIRKTQNAPLAYRLLDHSQGETG